MQWQRFQFVDWLQADAVRTRVLSGPVTWPQLMVAMLYIAAYVTLDWASYVAPIKPFGITAWNPHHGLSVALILLLGPGYVPLVAIASLVADVVVRGAPAPWWIHTYIALILCIGYGFGATLLTRPAVRFDVSLATGRDVTILVCYAALASAFVAVAYVLLLASTGQVEWQSFAVAVAHSWIGDVIGIIVFTPFILICAGHGRIVRFSQETLLQLVAVIAAFWLKFGLTTSLEFHVFYILFLPVVWVAVRHGLEGASFILVVTQLGVMGVLEFLARSDNDVITYQAMMLVLAVTGLAIGVTVSERRRLQTQLRLQQERQSRLSRIGSMGELAAALAHEINQPLAAATTYSKLVVDALREDASREAASDAARKAAQQVQRAADVVHRLREFIQHGRMQMAPVAVADLIRESLDLLQPQIAEGKVKVRVSIEPQIGDVLADRLQVTQVLLNLIHNSLDAMLGRQGGERVIDIDCRTGVNGFVDISIRDTGPGFTADELADAFEPFMTSKADGLGIGLALSRSIVAAHGGTLAVDNTDHGAVVHFTLQQVGMRRNEEEDLRRPY